MPENISQPVLPEKRSPLEAEGVDLGEETAPAEDEKSRRTRLMRLYIENQVLRVDPVLDEEAEDVFKDMKVQDKVNLLYEKVLARQAALKVMDEESEESVDFYLLSEIKSLWSDENVQAVFLDRYVEGRM